MKLNKKGIEAFGITACVIGAGLILYSIYIFRKVALS